MFTELISRTCIEDADRNAASDSGVNISCNLESNSAISFPRVCYESF